MFKIRSRSSSRSTRPALSLVAGLLAFSVFATGCGSDSSSETTGATGQDNSTTGVAGSTSSKENGDSSPGKNGTGEAGEHVARDGKWQLGDAGQVSFSVDGGELQLVAMKPRSGWSKRIADEGRDDIEVHFTRGSIDWKFEAELDGDRLEISREMDDSNAEPGSYDVGDAARVDLGRGDSGLKLNDVTANNGWKVTKRDIETDGIEIEFSRSPASAEFEAEIEDGDIHLEIDLKTEGPIPD